MNIFYISQDPYEAATMMVDKHVVKMVLETAQILSTVHRFVDGMEFIEKHYVQGSLPFRFKNKKVWTLPDSRENVLYKATHINHPSTIWARQSNNNYNWLYCHFIGLLNEYTYRYNKTHKCDSMKNDLQNPPKNIPIGVFTSPTPAMPDEYKVPNNSLESYRNYYKYGKINMHKWSKRNNPDWI